MAALSSQSFSAAGTNPTVITAAASDTIARSQFGPNGCALVCITSGTAITLSVSDPGTTPLGNAGTVVPASLPATGNRVVNIPIAAINPATDLATITPSVITGLTYWLFRY